MTQKNKWEDVNEGEWKNDKKHGSGICTKYGKRYIEKWYEGHYVENRTRKSGRLYDYSGHCFGRIDCDGNFLDEKWNRQARVDSDGEWYDLNEHKKGKIFKNGEVRDEHYNIIGKFEKD